MPERKRANIPKRRATSDYSDATAAMQNRGDDPFAMVAEGAGGLLGAMGGGATPGEGLSDELVMRLAAMAEKGQLSPEELRNILMARASLPEVVGG